MKITFTRLFIFTVLIFLADIAFSQSKKPSLVKDSPEEEWSFNKNSRRTEPIVCHGTEHSVPFSFPPSSSFQANGRTKALELFELDVPPTIPDDAQDALEFAMEIWEDVISSNVKIRVKVNYGPQAEGVLASASPTSIVRAFKNSPKPEVFYPISLAEKIANQNLNGNEFDIEITFNSTQDWYFGTDQRPPSNLFDFVSVALHELGHGLGFFPISDVNEDTGFGQLNSLIYSDFLVLTLEDDKSLSEFPPFSVEMGNILTGQRGPVHFLTPNVDAVIYTPAEYAPGSSVSHIDQLEYAQSVNSLMTPSVNRGSSQFNPGISGTMLQDMGWKGTYIDFEAIKSSEDFDQSFDVLAGLVADFGIDTTTFMLHYSTDSFKTEDIAVPMVYSTDTASFKAVLPNPGAATTYSYYLTVTDGQSAVVTNPPNGATQPYLLIAGPDTIVPEIDHTPVDFVQASEAELKIEAIITDNFTGVASASVEYTINGGSPTTIPMTNPEFPVLYEASIAVNGSLNGGDVIGYKILAVDSATNANTGVDPTDTIYAINVEAPSEPQNQYENDFNEPTDDFLGTAFTIETIEGFDDGAIHSKHPYEEAQSLDLFELDYIIQLQVPIILSSENPFMQFDEVVLVEPSEPGVGFGQDGFWDYVVVEGSKDEGLTWVPFSNGIDSRASTSWLNVYNSGLTGESNISTSVGDKSLFETRKINLTEKPAYSAGDVVLVRFRLFSDQLAAGWGWAIDNLLIQSDNIVGIEEELAENSSIRIYPNPSSQGLYQINAQLKDQNATGSIIVRNVMGREILNKEIRITNGQLNELLSLEDQPGGVYLVTTVLNGENATYKVIKSQ